MNSWFIFWFYFFWVTIIFFLINPTIFFSLIIYSELTWTTLYILTLIVTSFLDDAGLISLSFFLFALAGLEFSLGFMLIILFKNYNYNVEFNSFENTLNDKKYFSNKLYLKRHV